MRSAAILERVRGICLALPGASEKEAWGAPTFRVGKKLFAMFADNHHGDGRIALWCKAPPGAQDMLVSGDPERFFVPPYVGVGGWVGARLDRKPEWRAVAHIVEQGWRMVAPRRLLAATPEGAPPAPPKGPARGRRKISSRRPG